MGIDMHHVLRLCAGIVQGGLECAGGAQALGIGGCDVVGVSGDCRAGQLGVDAGAAGQRVLFG